VSRAAASDPIFALATPVGAAQRAVVRLSGPNLLPLLAQLVTPPPTQRGAHVVRLNDGEGGQPCWIWWLPGPRSYTGEDVAELHLLGSAPLIAAAHRRLHQVGLRQAEPGEFTRRALLAGRLDLDRAEGVLALVSASNAAERRAAAALYSAGVGSGADRLRGALEDLAARLEASLDFEEDDAGHVDGAEVARLFATARREQERAERAALARTGSELPRVALLGLPNAGKSRLFNRLLGQDRALVADLAGTTRDVLCAPLVLPGSTCWLLDLPGLEFPVPALGAAAAPRSEGPRESWRDQELAAAAQAGALEQRAGLDLEVLVVDASQPWPANLPAAVGPRLLVLNQIDRPTASRRPPSN
jgi:tRNA modification GTPase